MLEIINNRLVTDITPVTVGIGHSIGIAGAYIGAQQKITLRCHLLDAVVAAGGQGDNKLCRFQLFDRCYRGIQRGAGSQAIIHQYHLPACYGRDFVVAKQLKALPDFVFCLLPALRYLLIGQVKAVNERPVQPLAAVKGNAAKSHFGMAGQQHLAGHQKIQWQAQVVTQG